MELDVATWFASTAALSGVIIAIVSFIKTNIYKTTGWITVALSLALGVVGGLVGHFGPWLEGSLLESLTFGLTAGLMASGGWDAIRGLLGK